jgi:hypothetical protein
MSTKSRLCDLEVYHPLAAVRAILEPERYGATRAEVRAAVQAFIGADPYRARQVRDLLAAYTYPSGALPKVPLKSSSS